MKTKVVAIGGVIAIAVITIIATGIIPMSQSEQQVNGTMNASANDVRSAFNKSQVMTADQLFVCDNARSTGQMTLNCNQTVSQTVVACGSDFSISTICSDPKLGAYSASMSKSAITRVIEFGSNNATYYSGWSDYASNHGFDILYPLHWQVRDANSTLNIVPPEGKGYFRILKAPVNESDAPQFLADWKAAIFGNSTGQVIQNLTSGYNGQYYIPGAIYAINDSGTHHLAVGWKVNTNVIGGDQEYAIVFTGPHEIFLKYAQVANEMLQTLRFDQSPLPGNAPLQQFHSKTPASNQTSPLQKCPVNTIPYSNGCLDPGNYLG